jgi:hypothetical protein
MSMYCLSYWLFGGVSIQRFDMIMGAVLYIRIGSTEYETIYEFM